MIPVCVAGYFFPGQCIQFGFRYRLLLRVLLPTLLLIVIPLCTVAFFYCHRARGHGTRSRWLRDALEVAAPFDLFICFLLCPTVSKGIFDTWDCTEYDLNGATASVRTFLNADLQIVCSGNDYPEEYNTITTIAMFSLLLWPIGMPLIFFLVLFPNREALRQRRSTRMVKATAFLHKEYDPTFYWWEIVSLAQRLVLTGFVLLIPVENEVWRIFFGLLTAFGYLSLITFVKPYKRKGFNTLSIASQFSLVCVFLGGIFIKLFSGDGVESATHDGAAASEANEDSVLTIVGIMVVFNFSVLVMFVTLAAIQFSASSVLPSVRLVASGQVPELKLGAGHRYHLFLSHVWSSGQDQMATVKRELQLLLSGVRVFLDVDDLEEIGQLDNYVRQTQSMLLFLSKGYFFSANCKKEVAATLANNNPVMLLHETDPNRGGTSIEQMLADCPDDWREEIFVPRRPVIPWLRVKEFKIVSLKMIVSSMLLHQSKMERKLQALDEDIHAMPRAEFGEVSVRRTGKPAFALACHRYITSASSRNRSSAGAGAGAVGGVGVAREPTMSVHTESCADTPGEKSGVYAAQKWLANAEGAAASSPSCSPSAQQAAPAASHAEDITSPDVHTLGADLYVPGEVMRQQLNFPPTVLTISNENSGVARLEQEI